jgi:hypothetical protein
VCGLKITVRLAANPKLRLASRGLNKPKRRKSAQRKTQEIEREQKAVAVAEMQAEKFAIRKLDIFERSALQLCQTQIAVFKFAQICTGENTVCKRAVFVFTHNFLFGKIFTFVTFAFDVIFAHNFSIDSVQSSRFSVKVFDREARRKLKQTEV